MTGRRRGASAAGSGEASAGDGPAEDPVAVGREICLRALTAAPRTRGELATAMRRRRVPDEAATEVLDRLTSAGLIDDAAFAEVWVSSRHGSRGLSRSALAGELRRRGVDQEVAGAALEQLDEQDERRAATALVRRRLAVTARLPAPVRARRLVAMLARKGYPGGLASEVVREVLRAQDEAVDDLLGAGEM